MRKSSDSAIVDEKKKDEQQQQSTKTMIEKGKQATESINYEFDQKNKVESVALKSSAWSFLTESDRKWLLYLTILAFLVRLAFLNHPSVVIFDEVHFGGFAQKYLKGEFFFDLHPPLARLLVTLSAWIGGFDTKFSFYDIGADYLKPRVPYIVMRLFCGVTGVLVMPVAFVTMRGIGISFEMALTATGMLLFDNAFATQSRYILLDAYLVIFTTLVGLFWMLFQRQREQPFTRSWKLSLIGLGVSMALAASCKWVGLFTVSAIGIYTIADLWQILGDTKVSMKDVGRHFGARVIALILIPVMIYASTFWVHFRLTRGYSTSASGMSLEFQQGLTGGALPPTMEDVYFGSKVRLRQYCPDGPFLHSHSHLYPEGSKQQQVTGYHHRDQNNLWILRRPFVTNVTYETNEQDEQSELIPLSHGDLLRFEHTETGRFLHSHSVSPPVSNKEKQYEVSCYAHHPSNFSDLNDNWKIEIVDEKGDSITKEDDDEDEDKTDKVNETSGKKQERPRILAIGTKFRLVHTLLGCSLHCRNKLLPDWGYKQAEITCGRETLKSNQIWIIEGNTHSAVDMQSVKTVVMEKSGFWSNFVEMNKKMWRSNAGLSADHTFASRPNAWPLLDRGIGFWNGHYVGKTEKQWNFLKKNEEKPANQGGEANKEILDAEEEAERQRMTDEYKKFKGQQVYLIGNPVVWWSATVSIGIYICMVLVARISRRRDLALAKAFDEETVLGRHIGFLSYAGFMFIQWLWHFVPFFGMHRQLFLHHYLPALYFSVLLFALMLDSLLNVATSRLEASKARKIRLAVMTLLGVATIYVFWRLAPLGYGLRMSKTQCEGLKWLKAWDFDCGNLVDPVTNAIITSSN